MQQDEAQKKTTYVSPGPSTEKDLRDNIRGSRSNLYLLPEYVTSFVLARDVKLQFSEVNANSVSHAMQMVAGSSLSANYGIFSMKASFGIKKNKQSVTADRTANGIIIKLISQVLRSLGISLMCFPDFQDHTNNNISYIHTLLQLRISAIL